MCVCACVCACVCVRTISYKFLLPLSLRCGGVYISSLCVLIGFGRFEQWNGAGGCWVTSEADQESFEDSTQFS